MTDLIALKKLLGKMQIDVEIIKIIVDLAAHDIRRSKSFDESKHVVYDKEYNAAERPILKIPTAAPALWADKVARGGRDPAQFIRHYYGEWLNSGLAKLHLRTLDRALYYAYWMWEKRQPPGTERLLPARPPHLDRQ